MIEFFEAIFELMELKLSFDIPISDPSESIEGVNPPQRVGNL